MLMRCCARRQLVRGRTRTSFRAAADGSVRYPRTAGVKLVKSGASGAPVYLFYRRRISILTAGSGGAGFKCGRRDGAACDLPVDPAPVCGRDYLRAPIEDSLRAPRGFGKQAFAN